MQRKEPLMANDIIKLSQDDITEAIGFILEAKGANADVGTIRYRMVKGQLSAELEGQLAEEEVVETAGVEPESEGQHLSKEGLLELLVLLDETEVTAMLARTQRESLDSFTDEPVPAGTDVIWFEGIGLTRAPLERWPEKLRKMVAGGKEEAPLVQSEAAAAADILGGGDEGPLDRGKALGKALRDG